MSVRRQSLWVAGAVLVAALSAGCTSSGDSDAGSASASAAASAASALPSRSEDGTWQGAVRRPLPGCPWPRGRQVTRTASCGSRSWAGTAVQGETHAVRCPQRLTPPLSGRKAAPECTQHGLRRQGWPGRPPVSLSDHWEPTPQSGQDQGRPPPPGHTQLEDRRRDQHSFS